MATPTPSADVFREALCEKPACCATETSIAANRDAATSKNLERTEQGIPETQDRAAGFQSCLTRHSVLLLLLSSTQSAAPKKP